MSLPFHRHCGLHLPLVNAIAGTRNVLDEYHWLLLFGMDHYTRRSGADVVDWIFEVNLV